MKTTLTIAAMALAIVTGSALPLDSAFAHGNDRDRPSSIHWKGNKHEGDKHWYDHDRKRHKEWRSDNDHRHGYYCNNSRHRTDDRHYHKKSKRWCDSPRCYAPFPRSAWNGLRIDGTFIFD